MALACPRIYRRMAHRLMKALIVFVALACLSVIQLGAQPGLAAPRLVGIVNLPERKCVLLEIGGPRPGSSRLTLLCEGERDWFAEVEVLHVNAERGSAELKAARTNMVIALDESSALAARTNTMVLTNAPLASLLDLYGRCSGRA